MTCPKCGGQLVLIDTYTCTFLCDTCWYEYSNDGIINDGEYNKNND